MTMVLLDVQPKELKFTFEPKKKSMSSLHLVNNSDQCVAFKVKTTSPKRYSVRPNMSIILPKFTCDVTVTMEAQSVGPPAMQCKDKFLIQSSVVPFGTTEEDIKPSMFSRDNGKYVEEHKLRVALTTLRSPISGPIHGDLEHDSAFETPTPKDPSRLKDLPSPPMRTAEDLEGKLPKDVKELNITKDVGESRPDSLEQSALVKDIEELKLRVNTLDLKLREVRTKITALTRLRGEPSTNTTELNIQLAMLGRGNGQTEVQEGFSILAVGFVAILGVGIGYLLNP